MAPLPPPSESRSGARRDSTRSEHGRRRKHRVVVVSKAEKAERDGRRREAAKARAAAAVVERDVPDVDELRRSRAAYYGRSAAERETGRLRPMVQEEVRRKEKRDEKEKISANAKAKAKANAKAKIKEEAKDARTGKGKVDTRTGARRAKGQDQETADGYERVYVHRVVAGKVAEVRQAESSGYGANTYRRDRIADEELRSHSSEEDLTVQEEEAVPASRVNGAVNDATKGSRATRRISTHSRVSGSSTVRSRSRSKAGSTASKARSSTAVRTKHRASHQPMTSVPEDSSPISHPSPTKSMRRTSIFAGLLPSKSSKSTNSTKPSPSITSTRPTTNRVECLTCTSLVPSTRAAHLSCGHTMCHSCLRHIFELSVRDPQHMPPRCCDPSRHIPLRHVARLFDDRFKRLWNRKYAEYTTRNRLYCPAARCGTWIEPRHTRASTLDPKRRVGTCPRCRTRVCGACGRRWHTSSDCEALERDRDGGAREFARMAASKGWQRCFNCTATVELKEGCNHMTCRCGAEFCMKCGLKWKGCDCPWFNYSAVADADRLVGPEEAVRRTGGDAGHAELGYAEELARRREQERRDAEFARRMQGLELAHWDTSGDGHARSSTPVQEREWGGNDTFGYGAMAGHFLNDHFVRRATRILTGNVNDRNRQAADRLVAEIRADRAPPLPETAVIDPIPREPARAAAAVDNVLLGEDAAGRSPRRRPTSRRFATGVNVLDSTDIPMQAEPRRAPPAPPRFDGRRRSVLAGLATRPGEGRVDQWRQHVNEGEPVESVV